MSCILLIVFIDKILAHNPTDHCSKQIAKSKETQTEVTVYYVITQCIWLDDYRSEKYGWAVLKWKSSEIFFLAKAECDCEYIIFIKLGGNDLGHTKGPGASDESWFGGSHQNVLRENGGQLWHHTVEELDVPVGGDQAGRQQVTKQWFWYCYFNLVQCVESPDYVLLADSDFRFSVNTLKSNLTPMLISQQPFAL